MLSGVTCTPRPRLPNSYVFFRGQLVVNKREMCDVGVCVAASQSWMMEVPALQLFGGALPLTGGGTWGFPVPTPRTKSCLNIITMSPP